VSPKWIVPSRDGHLLAATWDRDPYRALSAALKVCNVGRALKYEQKQRLIRRRAADIAILIHHVTHAVAKAIYFGLIDV
jgi:hypothetical protein